MNLAPADRFRVDAKKVLADSTLRRNFLGAMDYLTQKRKTQFPDLGEFEKVRQEGEAARKYALALLPELLEQLEKRLIDLGVKVHWAEKVTEAQDIIFQIMEKATAPLLIKGKSMVSEEIFLNEALAKRGIEALETDMGEYIVQLAGEHPSHIIMPAIHKTKAEIAQIFAEKVPGAHYTDEVDALIGIGRRVLRDKFQSAKVGLSGVNFAIAETGTLCLVENEGNGRMCTSIPNIHIAIMGIEKVVARWSDLPTLLTLLTRSATGQKITTYLNFITGPKRIGEKDGPSNIHLILVDNGRTQAYADESFRATLQCIRCGACINHCPIYARVGGLAYHTTYPGPIGKIISPHLLGLKATSHLVTASTLCGACDEVCPVKIPISHTLIKLRAQSQADFQQPQLQLDGQGAGRKRLWVLAFSVWQGLYSHPRLYRTTTWAMTKFRAFSPTTQGAWTRSRIPMKPAKRTLHQILKKRKKYNI